MRSVSWTARISVLTVIVVLLVPSAMATDIPSTVAPSLWEEFVVWLAGRLDVPGGVAAADDEGFNAWLMSRIGIPGG